MDNIFIDTSIFEANNFLDSKQIKEILRLSAEKKVKIILPELTVDEIKNRIRKNLEEVIPKLNSRKEYRILKNVDSLIDKLEPVDENSILKELHEKLEQQLTKANVEVIPYPKMDIKAVFNGYFSKTKPFGSRGKKEEFPDAFALSILENWCRENNTKCIVFSNDNDLAHFESDVLIHADFKDYLNLKLKAIEEEEREEKRIALIEKQFHDKTEKFSVEIEEWLRTILDDNSIYYDYSNFLSIHDVNVIDIDVKIHDYKFVSISPNEINLQGDVLIEYSVEITFDDQETGWYDDEDKVWHYFDVETKTINKKKLITVDFKYAIPPAGEEFAELEIESINSDNFIII